MATLTTLVTFGKIDGSGVDGSLVADSSGDLFGATSSGGAFGYGTIFEIKYTNGAYAALPTTLVSFNNTNGSGPTGKLIFDSIGDLYGTTNSGTASGAGTVFEIAKDGNPATGYAATPTTLVTFDGVNGATPYGGLIADAAGNLYGLTSGGGKYSYGAIFKLAKDPSTATGYAAKPTTLASFSSTSGGFDPRGDLIADAAGNLYGTTLRDAATTDGTVFKLAKDGSTATGYAASATTLVTFNGANGSSPEGSLNFDAGGNLFGTTLFGGANGRGTVFEITRDGTSGTGFSGSPTTLVSFQLGSASSPIGTLVADAAGNLFGTTGGYNYKLGTSIVTVHGTVFEVAKDSGTSTGYASSPTIVTSSFSGNDGPSHIALIPDASGNLFGSTAGGGSNPDGTVFEVTNAGFVVCFVAGTAIRTANGDVAVEDLGIGDFVVTASGEHRRIRWLGQRRFSGRFANRNPDVLPICFKAGSLADGVPARDLWVSPKHAMSLDGVLVPAECLLNGVSVVKAARVDRVDYHHVELDSHDVLLAEGAPSESFVDDDSRTIFHNAGEHAALYPDAVRTEAVYCAPRIEAGFKLEAIRRRLAARIGRGATGDRDWCDVA